MKYTIFMVIGSMCGVYAQILSDVVVKVQDNATMQVKLPAWKPKTEFYDPTIVDWRSVIAGCRATCRYDKRLCNFYIRAAAHDSLSVSEGFGGADGSVVLTADEIRRPENNYDSFAFLLSKNILALAKRYNSSVADVVAVCGAVATEYQGGPTIISNNPTEPFLVGRFDKLVPNPVNALAPADLNTTGFASFAERRNLTIEEMTALMGSHSLIDHTGCTRTNGTECDPTVESCTDLRMFRWSNTYYRDVCSPNIRINNPPVRSTLPLQKLSKLRTTNMCKFTSPELRQRQVDLFDTEILTVIGVKDPEALVIDLDTEMEHVSWFSKALDFRRWLYTVNDAWLGLACQRKLPSNSINTRIGDAMNVFQTSTLEWDRVYIRAYKKMVNVGASWAIGGGFEITGDECKSGYTSALKALTLDCSLCSETARRNGTYNCDPNCKCKTAFSNSVKFYTTVVV
jgi:hypothetical protein